VTANVLPPGVAAAIPIEPLPKLQPCANRCHARRSFTCAVDLKFEVGCAAVHQLDGPLLPSSATVGRFFKALVAGEERRRLKIVPNAFGEKPVLKLMFGALIRCGKLARLALHRIRTASTRCREKRSGCRIRDLNHPIRQAIPAAIFQQIRALTPSTDTNVQQQQKPQPQTNQIPD